MIDRFKFNEELRTFTSIKDPLDTDLGYLIDIYKYYSKVSKIVPYTILATNRVIVFEYSYNKYPPMVMIVNTNGHDGNIYYSNKGEYVTSISNKWYRIDSLKEYFLNILDTNDDWFDKHIKDYGSRDVRKVHEYNDKMRKFIKDSKLS